VYQLLLTQCIHWLESFVQYESGNTVKKSDSESL